MSAARRVARVGLLLLVEEVRLAARGIRIHGGRRVRVPNADAFTSSSPTTPRRRSGARPPPIPTANVDSLHCACVEADHGARLALRWRWQPTACRRILLSTRM